MARRVYWDKIPLRPSIAAPYDSQSLQQRSQTFSPIIIYGTAWKKERTEDLVYQAIHAGFRAIDTAAQPKHYREDLVGKGIARTINEGFVRREDLYIQTKFTSIQGQDPKNMPYDSSLSVADQVHASVKSSLRNFSLSQGDNFEIDETTYIDTLVLHSPLPTLSQTFEAWAAAESYIPHRIRNLGISNCDLKTLDALNSSQQIRVKPAVLQNRFYQDSRYDVELRSYCRLHEIAYQSFWTLTANPYFLGSPSTAANLLARETGITPAAAVYCLVLGLGNTTVLDGTSNITHMKEDLASPSIVQKYLEEHPENGTKILDIFKKSIGDTI